METGTTFSRARDAIARELGVTTAFDAAAALEKRIAFLADYLTRSGRVGYVLGISGGVDSTVAARIAQLAVERVRSQGKPATFIGVRLPYGEQRDEEDAARALDFIAPDRRMRVDIKPAVDAQREALCAAGLEYPNEAAEDFNVGNIKARQRMIAQYAIAGAFDCLVIGTDQAAEALMGFFHQAWRWRGGRAAPARPDQAARAGAGNVAGRAGPAGAQGPDCRYGITAAAAPGRGRVRRDIRADRCVSGRRGGRGRRSRGDRAPVPRHGSQTVLAARTDGMIWPLGHRAGSPSARQLSWRLTQPSGCIIADTPKQATTG